ncbi:MAG: SelL-related redox protein [Gemmatimonadaceae bacterium]
MTRSLRVPRWLRVTLVAAGVFNLLWGAWLIAAPAWIFTSLDLAQPNYPLMWQGIGLLVAIHGGGYLIAAGNPVRHWPIVFLGLLGKVLAPAGVAWGAMQGELPWRAAGFTLANDVVWWVPFAMLLWYAARDYAAGEYPRSSHVDTPLDAMAQALTNDGQSLLELSETAPRLVVFLRHEGCIFCRETLADLRGCQRDVERAGVRMVVVHMGMPDESEELMARYRLRDVEVLSDPLRSLYQAFRLQQGRFGELFGPRVLVRGMAATLKGHMLGNLRGDGLQMPGAFVVSHGRILRAFRHESVADRPDYVALARGECDRPFASTHSAA